MKVTFKNTKTKKSTAKKFRCVVKPAAEQVATVAKIASVKQDTFTKFTVTMSQALDKVAAADFAVVRDNDNQVITVKSATLDTTDKTKVVVEVYTSLTDAKTYTFTYTAADEAKTQSTAQVTVTDGVVADVNITPTEISPNIATLIEYQTLDANGVIVSQKGASKADSNVSVTWESLNGNMDNSTSKYTLHNVGDTAEFTVVYHTYKYNENGVEQGVITKKFTVTAVKDATVISQYVYTAKTGSKPYDWSKVTPKTSISIGDEAGTDAQRTAYFQIKDAKGNDVTDSCGYTVESADSSIVVADGTVAEGAKLSPVAKGSTYLKISDTDGNVVQTLPITVGDKRTVSVFTLSANNVSIVSSAAYIASDVKDVTVGYTDVTAKDQYGDAIDVTLTADKTSTASSTIEIDEPKSGTIRITGATTPKAGSATYTITGTDALGKEMTARLSVTSVDVSKVSSISYGVVLLDENNSYKVVSTIDTTIGEELSAAPSGQKVKAVLVEKKSGVVVKPCDADSNVKAVDSVRIYSGDTTVLKVVSNDGIAKVVSSAATNNTVVSGVTTTAIATDNGKLELDISTFTTPDTVKNLKAGTYTIAYSLILKNNKTDKATSSFVVKDTQTAVTAKIKETSCGDEQKILDVLKSSDYAAYYYGDVEESVTVNSAKVTYSSTTNGGYRNAYVTSVNITIKVAGQQYTETLDVPVNKTFTSTAGWVE